MPRASRSWGCPGADKCHGPVKWCQRCGDVGAVCDCEFCMQHFCSSCLKGPLKLTDGACEACWTDLAVEVAELDMLRAAGRGDESAVEREAAWLKALTNR